MRSKVVDAAEAVAIIRSGDTVASSGATPARGGRRPPCATSAALPHISAQHAIEQHATERRTIFFISASQYYVRRRSAPVQNDLAGAVEHR